MVRKGEITCYKQFLLFSQCFPQLYIFSESKCGIMWYWINSLTNDKFVDMSKFKTFASDKSKVVQTAEFVPNRVENNVGKGVNTDHQHFLLFQDC